MFLAKSDYFDEPLPPRGRQSHDRLGRAPPAHPSLGSGALLLDAYGGALNRPAADATAFVHRDMLFSLQYLAYHGAGSGGASSAGSRAFGARCGRSPRVRRTRTTSIRSSPRWQRAYYAGNLERLREIKKRVDPDFRFRFGQAIPPAA